MLGGVTTNVSARNININWAAALKKNPNTRGLSPSLLRILVILLQTSRTFVRFQITAGQSSSAANNTLPK